MIKNPLLSIINHFITPYTLYWGAAIGAIIGGISSQNAADTAADAQKEAAERAASGAAFNPWDVSGAFGRAQFEDGGVQTYLTPEMKAIQDQYIQQAGQFAGQGQTALGAQAGALGEQFLGGIQADPFAAAETQFGRMEEILNPARQRQREALEGRLLKQGRLGSTGGTLQQEGLETAIDQSSSQNLAAALAQSQGLQQQQSALGTQLGLFGQQQQDVDFNQAQARLGGVQGFDQSALQYLNVGAGLGGRQMQGGALGGQFSMEGATAGTAAQLGAAAGQSQAAAKLGSAFGDYFGGSTINQNEAGGSNYYASQEEIDRQVNQ